MQESAICFALKTKALIYLFLLGDDMVSLEGGSNNGLYSFMFVCLFCCFTSQVNSYGHGGTVSSPNHTFSLAS